MTEKTVETIAGPFTRKRMESLRATLEQAKAEGMERDQATMFEGNELLISFGQYLLEFLDGQFAQRDHHGL